MFTVYLARANAEVTVETREAAVWQQKREIWVAEWNNTIRGKKNTIAEMYGKRVVHECTLVNDMKRNLVALQK